jgi:hypothetical protein
MAYYTRVLSKDEEFPSFEELEQLIQEGHPEHKLTIEEGSEEEWETLLLSSVDDVEVALIERNLVSIGSIGQDEIADFIEELQGCKPESGVQWLEEYLAEVKMIYAFQHLQGAETVEDGYHIVWQFSDSVSGPWNMGVLQDGVWYHFTMDLGDSDHRFAFFKGEVPSDLTAVLALGSQD